MTAPFRRIAAALALGLAALAMTAGAPGVARADADPEAALETTRELVRGAHGALTGGGSQADAELKAAIKDAFAFETWERFLLGDATDRFTEAQLEEFRDLLPGYLANLYKTQFGKGLTEIPEIRDTRPARRDVLVRASFPRENQGPLPVDWRIRDFGERGHLVIDVMVGGVSFLVLRREEFSGILESRGPEGLLEYMRRNSL